MEREMRDVETIISKDCEQEAEEVMKFMAELDQGGRGKILDFIRGAQFAMNMLRQNAAL